MRRPLHNSFGNDSNPVEQTASLPERGTGLETGDVGERRGDNPRTDEERAERHENKLPKGLVRTEQDGFIHIHQEGGGLPDFANKKVSKMQQHWNDNKEAYYLKR